MSARVHRTPGGAVLEPNGCVRFRLWAPAAEKVGLLLNERAMPLPMTLKPGGWHELVTNAEPGSRYQFVMADGARVPDPVSRFQPHDIHGPSEVIDAASYRWSTNWTGRHWSEIVLYELHIGAFTKDGTFQAAMGKLGHLAALGVTAIEIMPVADFPGRRNWGYDGALLYAPDSSYGRPEDFKALIEAAHACGIAVLLDVVYNHFGPEGNYLPLYAPEFFNRRRTTPWGDAINYDGAGSEAVREFVIHNALYWLEEFYLDGLRFDATHAIIDESARHVLDEIAERARAFTDRPIHLLLENEENETRRIAPEACAPPHFTAQWNDDLHHVLHVAATRERSGYYADYQGRTDLLAAALAEGFAYQGEIMPYRGAPRGEPSAFLPPSAFVAFIQNHDQIGNRAFGERLGMIAPAHVMRALSAVYLLLPQIPMMFMGEEWGAQQPFPFFCDFEGDLADAVRKGRREEFARFPEFADPKQRERIPDPLAEATFESAKLDWSRMDQAHCERYRALISVRKREITPRLNQITRGGQSVIHGESAVEVRWSAGANETLTLAANLSERRIAFPPSRGRSLWSEGYCEPALGPWSVRWSVETQQ
ncbi:Malto-oligosyltrehalose trehalohydrolase [Methylocella tundrae]|uniref:Malto-oligosyltrehalose trehalohydrolase n=1 Tax=Methylocella tundrae TaxID=227605 RepID=A0A8B6M5N9_METTU|nr:malto-oligosyltrehalose trehalohydrolase [Methylocella tundrae]VTZ26688.1 Malto-oligosyltrehalose trehalohydrolase [Methylocella tundrae]VTZ50148.1 Malto-oligosyltrehalose trehalohydrolase [Methylocella tundrae]